MKNQLNMNKIRPNYLLLKKIFKIISSRKPKTINSSKNIKNIKMMIISIKIIFTTIFSNTTIESVVKELKRNHKMRKFFQITEVPQAV